MTLDIEIQLYLQSAPFTSEDAFQIATAGFLNAMEDQGVLAWFFSGNNVYRRALGAMGKSRSGRAKIAGARAGALAKRMGAKAGIHDCIIYSHRMTIELKQPGNTLSPEQKGFKMRAEMWGWKCYRARTPGEVLAALGDGGVWPILPATSPSGE